jgi:hypothetical protein
MKTHSKFAAIFAVSTLAFLPVALHAQDEPPPPPDGSAAPPPPDASGGDDSGASFQQFYDQLGSQGQWIQTDNYGYVFQPTVTDPNWAPYTDGHWAYTDVGWTWVSDEPWGWATYHYGRWANIDGTGWVWVPGYEWAPAWVSWRSGGDYCGWAPLPPATMVGVDYASPGVDIGIGWYFGSDVDVNFGIGPGCYNFIRVGDFGEPYYRGRYIDRSRNFVIINNTTNITNIRYYSGRSTFSGVTVGGPRLEDVNAHARTPIEQVHLAAAGAAGRSTIAGGTLSIYAPHFNPATIHQARPTTVARRLTSVKLNRGTTITRPLAVNARIKPAAPAPEAVLAAQVALANAPSRAHIATAKTAPKTTLSKPLTSLQPATQERRAERATAGGPNPAGGQAPQPGRNQGSPPANNQVLQQEQAKERATTAQPGNDQALQQEQAKERAALAEQAQAKAAQRERAAAEQAQAEAAQRERAATAGQQAQAEAAQRERAEAAQQSQAEAAQRERAAAAAQERAPAPQQHAPVPQERTPAPQERTPAPQPQGQSHAAPASGSAQGAGDKNRNQNPNNQ